jgi:type II secretory pathway component PulF
VKLAYLAFDRTGRKISDTIEADSADAAAESLRRKGLYVAQIAASSAAAGGGGRASWLGAGRRLKQTALFTRQLSVLVSSGTPLAETLGALQRQAGPGRWGDALAAVRTRVEQGEPLSEAMAQHGEYFDAIYCNLIAAGESSGNILPILDRLANLKQTQLRVRNAIIGAMVYPCLLALIATAVLALLLVFVVPRFAVLFETLDVPLPGTTLALLAIGDGVRRYWWVLLAAAVAAAALLKVYLGTPAGRRAKDAALLRLPQIGKLARSLATARIVRLLGVLLDGRVPVLEALRLTRGAAGNVHYAELVARAEEEVSRGEPVCSAFQGTDLISPSVYEAIRSGEQSGRLGALLLDLAGFLDEENEIVVRSLTSIIEPIILVVMGLLVGVVAVSMFMPLFDLTAMAQGA